MCHDALVNITTESGCKLKEKSKMIKEPSYVSF